MRSYHLFLLLLLCCGLLVSCDPGNDLTINGQEEIVYEVPCGTLRLTSGIGGGEYFRVALYYDLIIPIKIDSEKFTVFVNNEEIPASFQSWTEIREKVFEIKGKESIILTFQKPLVVGDIVRVITSEGAVSCGDIPLRMPELIIAVDRVDAHPSPWRDE